VRGAKHRNITASPRVKPKITLLQLGRILNCIPSFKEPGVRTKPSTLHARARALSLSHTHSLSGGMGRSLGAVREFQVRGPHPQRRPIIELHLVKGLGFRVEG